MIFFSFWGAECESLRHFSYAKIIRRHKNQESNDDFKYLKTLTKSSICIHILTLEDFVKSSVNFDLKKNKSESLTYFLRRCLGQGTGCPKCLEMRISIAFDTALFKFFHLKIFKYAADLTGQLHNWTQCGSAGLRGFSVN